MSLLSKIVGIVGNKQKVVSRAELLSFLDLDSESGKDILEFNLRSNFPEIGQNGKIYIAKNYQNVPKIYTWDGSAYNELDLNMVKSVAGKKGIVDLQKEDIGLGSEQNSMFTTIASYFTFIWKCFTGFSISELRQLSRIQLTLVPVLFCNEQGRINFWKYDSADSTSTDNNGTVLVTNTGARLKAIVPNSTIYATNFGCISDWNDTTKTGTDCTQFIQNAFDWMKQNKISKFIWNGQFLVNGTIYVRNSFVPIHFEGMSVEPKSNGRRAGSLVYRQNSGDVFRVNMNEDGSGFLPFPQLFMNFGISSIQALRMPKQDGSLSTGMVFIREYRCQGCKHENIGFSGFDYLILQESVDSKNNENYCDQNTYKNISMHNSAYHGIKLFASDASIIERVTIEDPLSSCIGAIEMNADTNSELSGIVFWNPNDGDTPPSDSSLIKLIGCKSTKIKGIHIESPKFDNVIELISCQSIHVETPHFRFTSLNAFKLTSCNGVIISSFTSWEDVLTGKSDILLVGTANYNISMNNHTFLYFTGGATRDPIITGVGGVAIDRREIGAVGDADYTVKKADQNGVFLLGNITANRGFVLPSNPSTRNIITLFVRNNNNAFNWMLKLENGLSRYVDMGNGLGTNSLRNGCVYQLIGDSAGTYRVISCFEMRSIYQNTRGFVTLSGGVGSVSNSNITSNTGIKLTVQSGTYNGRISVGTINIGSGFTIKTGDVGDNCKVFWEISPD